MTSFAIFTASALLSAGIASGSPSEVESSDEASAAAPDLAANETSTDWSFSASVAAYFVPDDDDYVQPTLTLDHERLHLEARYNYEDLETTSAWVGFNLSFGEELTLDITPMIGAVFGETEGVAPGYEVTLGWRDFELYTEGEYLFDAEDSAENFFYTWTELTYSFTDWLYAGLVIERTRAYESDFDIQRGLLAGVSFEGIDLSAAVLNPDESDPIVILSAGIVIDF